MRHRNGVLQDRNVFVVDGTVMTVTRYHKSQWQWDTPRVVPRFLPRRLGRVFALYVGWLQKIHEHLRVAVLDGEGHDYIWGTEHGPWDTDRLTRIIERETGKRMGVSLTTQSYRHAAIGIGRKVVGDAFARGCSLEDETEEAEVDENEAGESALELMSGHTTRVGEAVYCVPIDIVKHLSERSIAAFLEVSRAWHRFLGLDDDDKKQGSGRKKRKLEETDETKKRMRMTEPDEEAILTAAMQRALSRRDVTFRARERAGAGTADNERTV